MNDGEGFEDFGEGWTERWYTPGDDAFVGHRHVLLGHRNMVRRDWQ